MLQNFRQILAPPIFEDDEETRIASLMNNILWAVIFIGAIYMIIVPFILDQLNSALLTLAVVVSALISRQLMIRGYVRSAAVLLIVAFDAILVVAILASDGAKGASYFSLVMTTMLAGILLGGRSALFVAGLNSVIGLVVMLLQNSIPEASIPQSEVSFFSSLVVYVFFVAALLQASSGSSEKILERLRNTQLELKSKNNEMQRFAVSLEATIEARTKELDLVNRSNERRAKQFEAIAKITKVITQNQNLDTLLPQISELISDQFGFYHTGIFLLDGNNEYAVLIAANSVGGKRMLERNHKLKIGQTGIVGYVAGTGLPRIALDTGADAIYFNNPDLPETRSELALPLMRFGNEVIGVLDVQSREQNAFNQEDVRTLSTLADQVSIAIENARLFEEQQKILVETQAVYTRNLRDGWMRFARSQNVTGIQRRNFKSNFLKEPLDLPGALEAARSGGIYKKNEKDGSTILTLPVRLREQIVGVLNIKSDGNRTWSDDEMDIVSAIMERAALSIENARLLEESRRTAEREHALSEISTKIGAGTQIEDILRTTVQELGSFISDAQITVEIGGGEN